jgi:hypothetical protein
MVHFLYFHENFHEKRTLQSKKSASVSQAELIREDSIGLCISSRE